MSWAEANWMTKNVKDLYIAGIRRGTVAKRLSGGASNPGTINSSTTYHMASVGTITGHGLITSVSVSGSQSGTSIYAIARIKIDGDKTYDVKTRLASAQHASFEIDPNHIITSVDLQNDSNITNQVSNIPIEFNESVELFVGMEAESSYGSTYGSSASAGLDYILLGNGGGGA